MTRVKIVRVSPAGRAATSVFSSAGDVSSVPISYSTSTSADPGP